eukprot:3240818-Prymnesium_polylepis.1
MSTCDRPAESNPRPTLELHARAARPGPISRAKPVPPRSSTQELSTGPVVPSRSPRSLPRAPESASPAPPCCFLSPALSPYSPPSDVCTPLGYPHCVASFGCCR